MTLEAVIAAAHAYSPISLLLRMGVATMDIEPWQDLETGRREIHLVMGWHPRGGFNGITWQAKSVFAARDIEDYQADPTTLIRSHLDDMSTRLDKAVAQKFTA